MKYTLANLLISPICPQLDSALHILLGCQHTQIRNVITERHNTACSMIFKQAISKTGSLGSCFVCMNIGSSERLAMQNKNCTKVALPNPIFKNEQIYLEPSRRCIGCSHLCEN